MVGGSPLATSLPCIAAAHIQSWSTSRREDAAHKTPRQTQPSPWQRELQLPAPSPLRYGWPSSGSLPTDNQHPARPQPPQAPSTATSKSPSCSDTHLESQPATLYQPRPAGPTGKQLQKTNASVSVSVQVFFFGSAQGWAQLESNNQTFFFLLSPKAASGGLDILSKKPKDIIS